MNKIVRLEGSKQVVPEISEETSLKDRIIEAIKTVYDPEIPVNLYDLGLIYDIDLDTDNNVHIDMTLTAPACPVADILPGQVACAVQRISEVKSVQVDLVFDPPWSKERMSEEARLLLDMM